MNLILMDRSEIDHPLPKTDDRAVHILEVLRRKVGDAFDVGLINGPKGKARLEEVTPDTLVLSYGWADPEPPLDPITLLVGLSRPQTNRKILQAAATMGVERMLFPITDRAEPAYAQSKLWTTGEYRRHLLAGVAQAFSTQVPSVTFGMSLDEALSSATNADAKLALDNYENTEPMSDVQLRDDSSIVLAVGSERGWTAVERESLRDANFRLVGLGERVLRTETAVVSALALVKAATGSWR